MFPPFKTLAVRMVTDSIVEVSFNRPEAKNTMNDDFWKEFPQCFEIISKSKDILVAILTSKGNIFTAGLDLKSASSFFNDMKNATNSAKDTARRALEIQEKISKMQHNTCELISSCPIPIIASIDGACIGGGIDLSSSCDIRYCSESAYFSIKEIDVGLVADLGTLSRINRICGNESLVRQYAMTGEKFTANDALKMGFISKIFKNKKELNENTIKLAKIIANKSPIAIRGIKRMCNYALDHSVNDCQDYVAVWNSAMLQSNDPLQAAMAFMQKKQPKFAKL